MCTRQVMRCEVLREGSGETAIVEISRWALSAAQANHDTDTYQSRYFELHHRSTWTYIQADLEALGDGPERLNYVCPAPPFSRASVSLSFMNVAGDAGVSFRICAAGVDLYVDWGFWDLWGFVMHADPTVSVHWLWAFVLRDDAPSLVLGGLTASRSLSSILGPGVSHSESVLDVPVVAAAGIEAELSRRRRFRVAFTNMSYRLRNNTVRRAFSRR
ncbi:uncharacterized protein N7511_009839 [Penicillium nucicola]|uniref:uncharacterized protein n=1 Tax=Penicillium nucicola TaxID=1850975 RepID=UPI002545103F|nr:uncharacterized protein N7511_009839 [Penicillium nucicola]KAJ5748143.1 hypothetical protein N7511_009839 [Penicillium nucicola]